LPSAGGGDKLQLKIAGWTTTRAGVELAGGKDPWTDPDPQPGDFDAELGRTRSDLIEIHEGNPDAKLSILVSVQGDDA
jgi:hypothetical protein